MVQLEIQEGVELWARQWGRHASVKFIPSLGCHAVCMTLPSNHPDLKLWREGKLRQSDEPTESIPLHEWDVATRRYVPLNLEDLGLGGIVGLLDKWNMWSGNGEFATPDELVSHTIEQNRKAREALRKNAEEAGREVGWLSRRTALGLPQVSVSVDLSPQTPTKDL